MLHAEHARRDALRGHDGGESLRHVNLGVEGHAHTGCILYRDPTARVDGLGLREHKRLLLAGGLFGSQPLQTAGQGVG